MKPLSLSEMAGRRLPLPHQPPLLPVLARRAATRPGWRCVCRSRQRCACTTGASLAAAPFLYDNTRYYALKVENEGPRIRAYIDGKLVLEASRSARSSRARPACSSATPARFQDFRVDRAGRRSRRDRAAASRQREQELARLRADNPKPKLWKKFDTPKFGAGRNVRFGDLDGDGVPDMLIAQNIPRIRGDAFDQISCLTAVTLDGKVLWQKGRPDPRNGLLTNDTPFQIHDIDGDGRNEIVLVRDFQLQILDGRTGELRNVGLDAEDARRATRSGLTRRETGDSIAFVNFSGNPGRREILVKDRYTHFWVYNNKLELLWKGDGQTGHYPFPFGCRWQRPRQDRDRLRALGPHRQAALEPRQGASATTPTAS